ncbi:hypothetical protein ACOMHN_021447 [Nucella lapillus]
MIRETLLVRRSRSFRGDGTVYSHTAWSTLLAPPSRKTGEEAARKTWRKDGRALSPGVTDHHFRRNGRRRHVMTPSLPENKSFRAWSAL